MKLAKGSLQIPACRQYGRRRDYGLTIFAYSLSAFQASSHIKRWPRGTEEKIPHAYFSSSSSFNIC